MEAKSIIDEIEEVITKFKEGNEGEESEEMSKCRKRLGDMISNTTTDPAYYNFLMYSGSSLQDLGDFHGCVHATNYPSRYILFTSTFILNLGLCIPTDCTMSAFQNITYLPLERNLHLLMGVLNDKEGNEDLKKLPSPFFTETEATNEHYGRIGLHTGLVIILLILLILVVILAALYDIFIIEKREEENRREDLLPTKSKYEEIIICFSIIRNAKALIYTKNKIDPNLDIFHGIRVLSICWVILGHSFLTFIFAPLNNMMAMVNSVNNNIWFSLITGATLSVDTFFTLSGFFSVLGVWEHMRERRLREIFKCYLHRYIRLFPMYAVVLLLAVYIFPMLAKGPANYFLTGIAEQCKATYMDNLLYINNLHPMSEQCIAWTWYLANDMQMFLLVPIFVYIYRWNPSYGVASLFGVSFLSSTFQLIYIYKNHWTTQSNADEYYIRPWMRVNTYLVGVLAAWGYLAFREAENLREGRLHIYISPVGHREVIYNYEHLGIFRYIAYRIRDSCCVRYICYITGIIFTFLALFFIYPFNKYSIQNNLYNMLFIWLSRPIFVIGLMLIVFPVLVGRGRSLFAIIGAPFFAPLGRITYGAYLVHLLLFFYLVGIQQQVQYYTLHMVILWTLRIILLSYILSLLLSLIVEAPIAKLESTIRGYKTLTHSTKYPKKVEEEIEIAYMKAKGKDEEIGQIN